MDNKISLNSLASAIALSSGKTKKQSEDFLREFFRLVTESLVEGEAIKIKGLGTFKIVEVERRMGMNISTGQPQEIPAHKKVVFTPAKELASAINAPFEEFESMELDDEMPEEFLEEASSENEIKASSENEIEEGILQAGSVEEGEDDAITYEAYHDMEENEEKQPETPQPQVHLPVYYEYPRESGSRFRMGFLIGALSTFAVCVVIFLLGCFFDWWPVNFGSPKEMVSQIEEVEQNPVETEQEPVEVIPEPEPVYDTVSTTRYLTTIAREHYGNFNFWPYIYIENQSILGHPDRITPGTKVVVPDLAKYGVDPDNKDDVAAAKQKGLEIYSRYK